MGDVIQFKNKTIKKLGLCQHGHHKWQVVKDNQFDSKQGKLVTVYACAKCGKQKVKAH